MCTLIILVDTVPGLPIVLAANRDELYDRPARAPALLGPGIVGGLDLRSGGSWLAIARDGRFAGVTNQRDGLPLNPPAPRSRGELVRVLVDQPDRAAMRAFVRALDASQYASANLVFGDASGADLAYARRAGPDQGVEVQSLPAGIHVLTNDRLGSPAFPKADTAHAALDALAGRPWPEVRAALPAILGSHATPPPERIPPLPANSPVPAELATALQALCIHTPIYGTRSATLAAIDASGVRSLEWADGPPCTTPFTDALPRYDDELRWRVVGRAEVNDYRIFRSTAVRSTHPLTGAERSFTVLDTPDWVNVVAVTPDQRVVLIRQWRHGADRVHIEIPGGMVDPGEDHETAARRELVEETGYTAPTWRHVGTVAPNPAIHGNRLFTWLAEGAVPTRGVTPDEGEVITTFTAAWPEVLAMLRDGRIDHALVVAGFAHLAFAGRLG